MGKHLRHRVISEASFRNLDFSYFGTLISGREQEIDIFRPACLQHDEGSLDVEIRVTLCKENGQMQYSCIGLTDHRGAPVLVAGPTGRPINHETLDVMIYEAIEYDDRSMDYIYGRVALGEGLRPNTLVTRPPMEADTLELD